MKQYLSGFIPLERADKNNPTNFVKFAGLALGARGKISFWHTPSYSGGTVDHVVDLLSYGIADKVYGLTLAVYDWNPRYLVWGIKGTVQQDDPRVDYGYYQLLSDLQLPPYSFPIANQPVYNTMLWDFSGTNTVLALYLNGAKVTGIATDSLRNAVSGWNGSYELRVGSRIMSGDWDRHNWNGADGIIGHLEISSGILLYSRCAA